MPLITLEDFKDIYAKAIQRGLPFLLSKLNPSGMARTKSAFGTTAIQSANWWIVPMVRQRWNTKMTGDAHTIYEDYVVDKYLRRESGLKMLSLGAGSCSHELNFAKHDQFEQITCIDIVQSLLDKGKAIANEKGYKHMEFLCDDLYQLQIEENAYDVILFHASLHHFTSIKTLLEEKVKYWLKPNGFLIVNEYVGANRLQYPKHQIKAINQALKTIPEKFRRKFRTNHLKKHYHGVGYLRMLIADPSECPESKDIRPLLQEQFEVLEEKEYGGNILLSLLKDIAHHFVEADKEKEAILRQLFALEDSYLEQNDSDMLFGVYTL